MKHVLLSYPLDTNTPCYGTNPPLKLERTKSLDRGDTCNAFMVAFHNHSGTHLDCPNHFLQDGKRLTDYALSDFIFTNPCVMDCPKKEDEMVMLEDFREQAFALKGKDVLLIRTSFGTLRGKEQYREHNPGVHPDAIQYVREKFPELRCIGIDSISFSSFQQRELGREAHRRAFEKSPSWGEPLLLLEDMNLSSSLAQLKKVYAVPLFIKDIDASPCTVIGEL